MSASITFTDAEGTDSLTTFAGIPDRFNAWTPDLVPIGPSVVGLGTGQTYNFAFRNDLTAALEISPLVGADLELALRLKMHLMSGGQVAVSTTNFMSTAFETCVLAPGTTPSIDFSDRQMMEYTFSVVLRSGTGLATTGGGRLTPYSPTEDTTDMMLWLKAGSLTASLADGDLVGYWNDDSGNARHATNAVAGRYPILKTNIVNSQPVVRFDNVNDELITGLLRSPNDAITVYIVYATRTAADGNLHSVLHGVDSFNNSLYFGWQANHRVSCQWPVIGANPIEAGAVVNGEWNIFSYTRPTSPGGTGKFFKNNTLAGTITGNLTAFGTMYVGNSSYPANADIAEVICYAVEHNTTELAVRADYLGTKYGITVAP